MTGKRILILGGSSFVGRHLFARLGSARAIATYNTSPRPGMVKFDATTSDLADVFSPETISHAVLLLGDTRPDSCLADPARSRVINVDGIERIIDRLNQWRVPIVFTSSDHVFSGDKGDYVEGDPADPIVLYGAQKLEVERYLERTARDWVTLRLAKVYGEDPADNTLFTGWLKDFGRVSSMKCTTDQRFSPVHVDDVCDAIEAAIAGRLKGLYHCAGPVALSRIELLELLLGAVRVHHPVELDIIPCSIRDFPLPEKRPLDVSLRPDRLVKDGGLTLRRPDDVCRRLAALQPRSHGVAVSLSTLSLLKPDPTRLVEDLNAKTRSFFCTRLPVRIDKPLLDELRQLGRDGTVRVCLHSSPEADHHDMVILEHAGRYYPPHKHDRRGECFHVVEGVLGVLTYAEDGAILDAWRLGAGDIYRVDRGQYHQAIPLSECVIYHESMPGPYRGPGDSTYPDWAPDGSNADAAAKFVAVAVSHLRG